MMVLPGPGWHRQLPPQRQMLSHCAYPCINAWVANRLRRSVEPLLLCDLVAVVEIEFIDKLVERHGEIRRVSAGNLCDFGQGLRASHGFHPADFDWMVRASSRSRCSDAAG